MKAERNLLNYLQTQGRFDAKVEIRKKTDPKVMHIIYDIDPGPLAQAGSIDITGNKNFLDTAKLRSYLQIQPAHRFLSHGKYSETMLKNDVTTLEESVPLQRLSPGPD